MEITNLDELQKLNVINDTVNDVELCAFTEMCGITCTVSGIEPQA